MRSAPSRELPPNLKATTLRHLLPSPPLPSASPGCAAGRRSASSSTFSWFMAYAPGFHSRVRRLELAEGSKTRNPPPGSLPAVGWKLFSILLAVFPIARSGNSLLHSRSRGSRLGRLGRLGSNSLLGDGHHHKREP